MGGLRPYTRGARPDRCYGLSGRLRRSAGDSYTGENSQPRRVKAAGSADQRIRVRSTFLLLRPKLSFSCASMTSRPGFVRDFIQGGCLS